MGSKPGAAVSNDEDPANSPAPSGSKKAAGSAGGSPPALKKKTAGKKKSLAKKATRKSATGKAAGKKAADKQDTGIKKAAKKVAGGRTASEKKTARRSRRRAGLAGAATPPDAVAQTSPATNTDDPRSLAWMAAAAVKALNAVRENQAAQAAHILNAQGAGTSAPAAEAVESPAGSGLHAESPAVSSGGEVSAAGDARVSPQEQRQPKAAVTIVEHTTPSAAVTELAGKAGKPGAPTADEAAESAVAQAVETTAAGAGSSWPLDGDATTGQAEPAGQAPLPPPAVAPRQRVPLRMMAGAAALILAVMIGYGYLADKDEVAVPVTDATPAVVNHSVQAVTESGAKTAAPGETGVAPHEQPVATTAEGTTAGLPPDETPVPTSGTANVPPMADPDTLAADTVSQPAATTAPQPVPEPVSRPEAEPVSTTASRTTAPVARQPDYRNPGYGYYPPGWRQPGYRYPAR